MSENPHPHWTEKKATRWIANVFAGIAILALVFVVWQRVLAKPRDPQSTEPLATATAAPIPTLEADPAVELAPVEALPKEIDSGITRQLNYRTIIPSRPRVDVITYTVQQGETLFGIAENFGIKPETVLWGNFDTLEDNPNFLKPGQALNILPTNGVYYQWQEGDSFEKVASEFKTSSEKIVNYPGNRFDLTQINEDNISIAAGTWVIVPDGTRPIKDWGPPAISRSNPASARYYGDGYCGSIYEGAMGTGTFIWPTSYHGITQGYSGVHPAIDVGGSTGVPIVAVDSGVVVFSGWSNYGYGYLVVIDHGNGFQSAYGHFSAIGVTCGQSVFQGGYIGAMGSTGNSTGPHLHLEIVYNGAKPNPLDFLP